MVNANVGDDRGSSGLRFTIAYFVGMLLLFVGERWQFEALTTRITFAVLAVGALAFAVVGRVNRRRTIAAAAKSVEGLVLLFYGIGLLSLLLYAAQADFVMERIRDAFSTPQGADRYSGALSAFWIVLWLCSALPVLFIEYSYASMNTSLTVEKARIERSASSALVIASSIVLAFALNYVVKEFDKKVDLSYFKTTRPSDSSMKMVKNLTQPFEVTLFFDSQNEVYEHLESYFNELKGQSKRFTVRRVDHVLDRKLAKTLAANGNGWVVFSRGKQRQRLVIGEKLNQARSKLRRLDEEFQKAFVKLSRKQKVAYLTIDHEELTRSDRDGQKGSSIRRLRSTLENLNYRVKDLGVRQGLGTDVPDDATLVIVAGPRHAFLSAELDALKRYLEKGGSALIALDPENSVTMSSLLGAFGIKFIPESLAQDRYYLGLTKTRADRYAIPSGGYAAHPAVRLLTKKRLPIVFNRVGYLEQIPPTSGQRSTISLIIRTLPFAWNDKNDNMLYDRGSEHRRSYALGAAVSGGHSKPKGKQPKGKQPDEMRLVVLADATAITDAYQIFAGNRDLVGDTLKWLGQDDDYLGSPTNEEDIRIVHSRKEDQVWFYLTIFGAPACVLIGGLVYTRRRRRA